MQRSVKMLLHNPYYPSKIDRRYVEIPFCTIIVDNKQIGFEIVDISEPKKFKMAIFSRRS